MDRRGHVSTKRDHVVRRGHVRSSTHFLAKGIALLYAIRCVSDPLRTLYSRGACNLCSQRTNPPE